MLFTIPDLLNSNQLERIYIKTADAEFIDGKLSAGRDASRVKKNEELLAGSDLAQELNELIIPVLYRHPVFQAAAMPLKLASAFIARYTEGMAYGQHIDDAVMGVPGQQYRSDISITIFLSSPDDYGGGELSIKTEQGVQDIKLPSGHAICYPSGSLHEVKPVTQGERLVAVSWCQSLVKQAEQRALLYDLYIVKETLQQISTEAEAAVRANRAYINLYRQLAEL